jgi:hypothetical protein
MICLFTKYYLCDQINDEKKSAKYSTNGREDKYIQDPSETLKG